MDTNLWEPPHGAIAVAVRAADAVIQLNKFQMQVQQTNAKKIKKQMNLKNFTKNHAPASRPKQTGCICDRRCFTKMHEKCYMLKKQRNKHLLHKDSNLKAQRNTK